MEIALYLWPKLMKIQHNDSHHSLISDATRPPYLPPGDLLARGKYVLTSDLPFVRISIEAEVYRLHDGGL